MQELNKIQRLSNTSKADTLLKSKAFAYTGCAQKVFNFISSDFFILKQNGTLSLSKSNILIIALWKIPLLKFSLV